MKTLLFFSLIFSTSLITYAQFPGWAWVREVNNQEYEKRHKIDRSGNLYYYHRYFNSTIKFGSLSGDTITVQNSDNTGGSADIVIAKYDSEANIKWAVSYGLPQGDEWITDLDVDSDGNVYIVGFYRGLYTKFENTVLNNPAYGANCYNVSAGYSTLENWECCYTGAAGYTPVAYRAKISPQGNLLWVKNNIIGSGVDSVNFSSKAVRLAVRPDGFSYVYIVGSRNVNTPTYSGFNFGNNLVIPNNSVVNTSPGYLAYFDPNGDAVWAKGIDLPIAYERSPLSMRAVAPDGGLVYSYSRDTLALNHTITSLIKISNTGANIFSTVLFDEHAVNGLGGYVGDFRFNNRIDFDEQGNIYVGGSKLFTSTPSLATDLTFFKFNNNGVLISTFQVPSDGDNDVLSDFTVTGIDTICFAGIFNGQFVQLGSEVLFNSNGVDQIEDTYFARYRNGGYDWQTIISPQGDAVEGMESDVYDNIYVKLITGGGSGTLSNVNYTCNTIGDFSCNQYGKIGNQTGMWVMENYVKNPVLYPNPVYNNSFTIAGLEEEKIKLKVFDTQGKLVLVKNQIYSVNPITIELPEGHYIIEITSQTNKVSRLPLIVLK